MLPSWLEYAVCNVSNMLKFHIFTFGVYTWNPFERILIFLASETVNLQI